jgi:hypothetical protein
MNTRIEPRRIMLLCQCGTCRKPWAAVQNGVLVITSWHDERHTNTMRLDDLQRLLEEATRLEPATARHE